MITPTTYGYTSPYSQYNSYGMGIPGAKDGNSRVTGSDECETCKNRKYQDGSNEMVSFKAAAHISPESAGAVVRAHEQEHVSNAYKKAAQTEGGKVINATVSIHTSTCPECGRTYVSGGTTNTAIQYNKDPYAQNAKKQDMTTVPGQNVSLTA